MSRNPLPFSEHAEQAALGSILIKPACFREVSAALRPDDFFLPQHRDVIEAMLAVDKRDRKIDVVAVADELKSRGLVARLEGGEGYLLTLANVVPTAENVSHYVSIVRDKATLRRLIAACAEIQAKAMGDAGDVDSFLLDAQKSITTIAAGADVSTSPTLAQIGEAVKDEIERAERGEEPARVATGIRRLDKLLGGGFRREHLVVPCGLTSLGKSSFAFQVAFRAAARDRVPALIFTLEMSREEVFVKGAATLERVDSEIFRPPPRGERANWNAIDAASRRASALTDLVRIETTRDIGRIVAIATAWRAANQDPRALIVVDLIQKVRGRRAKGDARHEEVRNVAADLKDLARDLNCPVIAPSQLDNDAAKEKRAPSIGDLRDSKAIEHEADVIIGIHRDRMLERDPEAELVVLKHRGGRVGKVTCQWRGAWQGFEDQAEDQEEERRFKD